jgi:hypothetical protein
MPRGGNLTVSLATLKIGSTGITSAFGEGLAEAASVYLEQSGHRSPVNMPLRGDVKANAVVTWDNATEQMRRCWNDMQVTVEHGAYGVAALLVPQISDMQIVQRSKKGTGFDYWLGSQQDDSPLFQNKARLEVSGILQGTESTVQARLRQKLKQTTPTDGVLPAFVVVVEFGEPQSRIADKCTK